LLEERIRSVITKCFGPPRGGDHARPICTKDGFFAGNILQ
jgi:hypothetical protein